MINLRSLHLQNILKRPIIIRFLIVLLALPVFSIYSQPVKKVSISNIDHIVPERISYKKRELMLPFVIQKTGSVEFFRKEKHGKVLWENDECITVKSKMKLLNFNRPLVVRNYTRQDCLNLNDKIYKVSDHFISDLKLVLTTDSTAVQRGKIFKVEINFMPINKSSASFRAFDCGFLWHFLRMNPIITTLGGPSCSKNLIQTVYVSPNSPRRIIARFRIDRNAKLGLHGFNLLFRGIDEPKHLLSNLVQIKVIP